MAKVFSASLSVESLNRLEKQLLDYRDNYLPMKCKELTERLLQSGIEVSSAKVSESPLGKYVTLTTNLMPEHMGCKGILLAQGVVKESEDYAPFSVLLAIEFGAGAYYNPTPNPKSEEFGYGVGTFPGQMHAREDMWFYWDEQEQEWKPTHGVKATMPMYYADKKMIDTFVAIARDVFSR